MAAINDNLQAVAARIREAAHAAGRDPSMVRLLAVTKTQPPSAVEAAYAAGLRSFGENYVQEAVDKKVALAERAPGLQWHLIGPLQSNKAAEAVQLFDAIHTVDRPKIATAIATEIRRQSKPLTLFVQVNTGREPQKAGIDPDHADAFLRECRELHGLEISGLMCIPPAEEDPKRHFTLLAEIATRNGLTQLSMGMSGDYASAIACGATHVRVGSAIFGTR